MSKFDKFCEAVLSGFITIVGHTFEFCIMNLVVAGIIAILLLGWFMADTWFEFMNGASLF